MTLGLNSKKRSRITVFAALTLAISIAQADAAKITVHGSAAVRVEPDIALLSIGVDTQNNLPDQAQAENNAVMKNLISAIASEGIKQSDMQTSLYNFRSDNRRDNEGNFVSSGFRVTNSLNIIVRDMDKLGLIIAKAIKAGGNDIGQLGFMVADSKPLVDKARKLAFENARKEAELSAQAAGMKLGSITMIANGRAVEPQPLQMGAFADIPDSSTPDLAPITLQGEVNVGYEVDVEYDLVE